MFEVKDSGKRQTFASGMRRDTQEGKILYHLVASGPMLKRWATHLTKGAEKYDENNWMKAGGEAELQRFRASAFRHFMQWYNGDVDEDHGSAVYFNVNGAEYVRDIIAGRCSNDATAEKHNDPKPNDPRAIERSESSERIRGISGETTSGSHVSPRAFSPSRLARFLGSVPATSPMVEPSQAPAYGASSQATRGYTDDPDTLRKWENACRKGT